MEGYKKVLHAQIERQYQSINKWCPQYQNSLKFYDCYIVDVENSAGTSVFDNLFFWYSIISLYRMTSAGQVRF